MAGPVWQSRVFQQSDTGLVKTVSLPASSAADDYIVTFVLYDHANSPAFTSIVPNDQEIATQQDIGGLTMRVFLRKLTAADITAGNVVVTWTANVFTDITVSRITGVSLTAPLAAGAAGESANQGTSAATTGLSVTPSVANSLLLRLSLENGPTSDQGMTQLASDDGGYFQIFGQTVAAGATGTRTSTQSPSDIWSVHMVALQPDAVAAAIPENKSVLSFPGLM